MRSNAWAQNYCRMGAWDISHDNVKGMLRIPCVVKASFKALNWTMRVVEFFVLKRFPALLLGDLHPVLVVSFSHTLPHYIGDMNCSYELF